MFEGITAATFEPILDGVTALLPIVLPVVVGFIGFRKGIRWLKGMIAGA